MATVFEKIDGALSGNGVGAQVSTQSGSLTGLTSKVGGLVSKPPQGIADLQKSITQLPLPKLNVGGNLAGTLGSLKSAVPTNLSSVTGSLTGGLDSLKGTVEGELVGVLKGAIDTAVAIYKLTQLDFRCDGPASSSGQGGKPGGASGGAGAPAASGGASASSGGASGASGGASAPASGGSPGGSAMAARVAAIDQVNQIFSILPTPFNVETLLKWLHEMTNFPRSFIGINLSIPILDDLRDPLETLIVWQAMNSIQIRDNFAGTLQATETFVNASVDAIFNPLSGSIPNLVSHMHADTLAQIADGLATQLGALHTAIAANNLAGTKAPVAAINGLIDQYNGLKPGLQTDVLAHLQDLHTRLTRFADDMEDQMDHILSILQPNGAIGDMEFFSADLNLGGAQEAIESIGQSLSTVVAWFGDIAKKIDLSAIKEPLKTVSDEVKSAVDALDNGVVTVTLEVQKLFAQVESLVDQVDTASIVAEVKTAIEKFRTELTDQLNQLFAPVRDALHSVVTEIDQGVDAFDPKQIVDSLKDVITQLTSVLDSGDVKSAISEIQAALKTAADDIQKLSFAPVTDQVIKGIDEVTTMLQAIDTSKLSPPLQLALQGALEILPDDLEDPVIKPLIKEFGELVDKGPAKLVGMIKDEPKKLLDQVRKFEPAKLIGDELSKPYEQLIGKMDAFKPSNLLKPVDAELDKLKDRLKTSANPGLAIKPLEAPFAELLAAFDKLKPEDIVKPLDDAIKKVTDTIINAIPVQEALDQVKAALQTVTDTLGIASHITGVLQKASDTLAGLANGRAQVEALVNAILAKVDGINDMTPLQQRIAAISTTLDKTRASALSARFDSSVGSLLTTLNTLDAEKKLTAIVQAYRSCSQGVGSLGVSPEKTAIMNVLGRFDPIQPSFSDPYKNLADLKTDLATAKSGLTTTLSDWDARYHGADGLVESFKQAQITKDQVKASLKEALDPRFTRPFGMLFSVTDILTGNVEMFLTAMKQLSDVMQSKLDGIVSGPGSLTDITASLQAVIDRIKNFNLSFLTDSLKGLFADVRSKLDAFNPAHLREIIDQEFAKMLDAINVGQVISPANISTLDSDYQKVVDKLKALDPGKLVIDVVQPEFEDKILPLLTAFDLTEVLNALLDKLNGLSGELKTELDKVNEEYKKLRDAVPSMSLSGAIGAIGDIGESIGISF